MPREQRATTRSSGDATRQRILSAAATIFAERGYSGTSVRMVARSIGLTDPAIHYHFPSKHALYLAVLSQPNYGSLPLDGAAVTREAVLDQLLQVVNWWLAHPELGQITIRGQLASETPALQYLAASEANWDSLITQPLIQLFGASGIEVSELLSHLLWGIYADAVFAYGDGMREVTAQPYFQERLRKMILLGFPEES